MQYIHPLEKPYYCDLCEQYTADELLRNINFLSQKGRLNYFVCVSCLDRLSDDLRDGELLKCAECDKEIRWWNDKCDCRR